MKAISHPPAVRSSPTATPWLHRCGKLLCSLGIAAASGLHAAESAATGPTQKAYILPRTKTGQAHISFALDAIYDDSYLKGTMWLVNPAVVKNWNQPEAGFRFELDGKALTNGPDYRFGFEQTAAGKDLVIWLNKTLDLNARDEHRTEITIIPNRP